MRLSHESIYLAIYRPGSGEFVNLIWPRVDGLKWPHLLSLSGLAVLR